MRVIGETRDAARLGDFRRQMESWMPLGRDGARQRGAEGFGARGLVAARIMRVGRDVAVEIGPAGDEAVLIVGESLAPPAAGYGAPLTAVGFTASNWVVESIAVGVAVGIGYRRAAVGIVGDGGQIGAARMLDDIARPCAS